MPPCAPLLLPVLAAGHKHPTWADFGPVEWVAIVVAGLLALWTVWKAVMYTLWPGEEEPDHLKRLIFAEDEAPVPARLEAWLVAHHGVASEGPSSDPTASSPASRPRADDRPAE